MSGQNRLIVSDETMEGASYEEIAHELLNANEVALEEEHETAKEEKEE